MMYHDNPRRSAPPVTMWYSVETPTVFREYKLPVDNDRMTPAQHRMFAVLLRLAEQHGTHIRASNYRRG